MTTTSSPVRLSARLEGEPSRGLWLVKWLLLVPHLVVLFFLWFVFPVLTAVALFAVLFTGRYPRSLFEFNLGVLRWTWRVWCYGYGGLSTDRYPPFSLDAELDYPATLTIDYPERLSRGLVLVKWWLLALPHYLVVAFLAGSGGWVLWQFGGGLVTLLALFAGVALLFTGRYPRGIFDLVVGMNRWVFRVAAYAALMTDQYPPFRLDTGGADPAAEPAPAEPAGEPVRWTPGRTAGVVGAVLLVLIGIGGVTGGGAVAWLDGHRDAAEYVNTPVERYISDGYALRFDVTDVVPADGTWLDGRDLVGDVRVRASGTGDLFAGIARTEDVTDYLGAAPYDWMHRQGRMPYAMRMPYVYRMGSAPPDMPVRMDIWDASVTGRDRLALDWPPKPGDWSLVVMNVRAESQVDAQVSFGATVPVLRPAGFAALAVGGVLLVVGAVVLVLVVRRRR